MCEIIEGKIIGCSRYARRTILRRDRLATGICTICGVRAAANGVVVCQECRDRHNARHRTRYNKVSAKRNAEAVAAGLCAMCKILPHRPDRITCEECGSRRCKTQAKRHDRSYKELLNDPRKFWLKYQRDAKNRKLDFSLTFEEFECITSQGCIWCGKKDPNRLSGIDRIDRLVGYHKDNCLPCCSIHNYMRNKMTIDEFLNAVEAIKC